MVNTFVDKYRTIANGNSFEFSEKNSVFIAFSFPMDEEELFNDKLKEIKKKYFDARHFCFAYKLKSGLFKYSDAGEPNGTAGIRIYNAIEHFDLTDTGVIVVRYFGGIKLGVGPLGKAYYTSAEGVLNVSEIITKKAFAVIKVNIPMDLISQLYNYLSKFNATLKESIYNINIIENTVLLLYSDYEDFKKGFINLTKGKSEISEIIEILYL